VNLPSSQIFEKPSGLTFEQVASLPVNYLTAYQLVVVMGSLRKGEMVLIHNAGGGVGLAALQIAKHLGAVTLGTASAPKHPTLLRLGLDHAIDYRSVDWEGRVKEITKGKGAELILDPIGGANWKKNYRLLRPTGRLGFFGVSAASENKIPPLFAFLGLLPHVPFYQPIGLMNENKGVFGVNLGHLWEEADKTRGWFMEILKGVKEGWIKPHVDRSYFFSEAAHAHQFMEERKNLGKVLLVP
jgi:NADPH:quinone reductase-like Zn-dependent oxidoreductase